MRFYRQVASLGAGAAPRAHWQRKNPDRRGGCAGLHSLTAGNFVVSVMPERPTGRAYVTYYPSTIEMPDAGVVTVESGKEVDVSIVVNPVQEIPISGVVRERDGAPAANMDVVLVPEQPHEHFWTGSGSGGASTRTSTDGLFILQARPGRYTLAARRVNAPGPREYAEQVLTVSTEPIAGLTLRTSLGATVSGRLVWEGADPQPWPQQTSPARQAVGQHTLDDRKGHLPQRGPGGRESHTRNPRKSAMLPGLRCAGRRIALRLAAAIFGHLRVRRVDS